MTSHAEQANDYQVLQRKLMACQREKAALEAQLAEEAKQAALAKLNEAIAREQEKAAQERAAELLKVNEALTNTLDRLAREPDFNAFLGYLLIEIARQVAAWKVHLFLYSAATNTLEQKVCVQEGHIYQPYAPDDPSLFRTPFAADITPAWQFLIQQQEIIVTAGNHFNEMHWPETVVWHQVQGHSLRATLALMAGEQPVGLMATAFRDRQSLQPKEHDLLRALANQATLAIQLIQLSEESKQAALAKLNEVTAREREQAAQARAAELARANVTMRRCLSWLAQEGDLNRFLKQVLLEIASTMGADLAYLFVLHEPRMLSILARVIDGQLSEQGSPTEPALFSAPFSADITPAFRLMEEQNLFLTLDMAMLQPELREIMWPDAVEWHLREGRQQVAALVLKAGERSVGFLGLGFREPGDFSEEERELVIALANQAALAIQMTRLAEEAQQGAILAERNRMAREIHDILAQAFTGIILQLEAAKGLVATQPDAVREHLGRASNLAREGLKEARRSVRALRPEALETSDLPTALQHLAQQMTVGTNMRTEVAVEGTPRPLPAEVETNLLRIGQEALTNAIRHAHTDSVRLALLYGLEVVQLQVVDRGQGFDIGQQTAGFGLVGMQERAQHLGGRLAIISKIGEGTTISVTVPFFGIDSPSKAR